MLWTRLPKTKVVLDDSELVFVGYGINAPEYNWNDYKGLNVKGKTVLIMVNDPGFINRNRNQFKGKAMTYYGRWTYKYEEAARQGAAAAIIIHKTAPASYPWQVVASSWSGKQFHLATKATPEPVLVEGWLNYAVATELLTKAGYDILELEAKAATAPSKPLATAIKISITLENTVEYSHSYNVGAMLPGTSAKDELMLYVAHWDHLGKKQTAKNTTKNTKANQQDVIYNGAMDNATGTAALIELGRAFTSAKQPKRSVGFLAVTAEESGLLGSAAYVSNPPFSHNKTIAVVNMDALNVFGPMSDIIVVGHNSSELEAILATAAATQNRTLVAEDTPEKGYFYRSDHFNFAKKGIPALYADGGTTHRERGRDYITKLKTDYISKHYHKPSDEVRASWDIRGMIEDITLYYLVGTKIAQSNIYPNWYKGNEFKAIRDKSIVND